MRVELTRQYDRIERYARSRSHKLTTQVHELQLSIEVLHRNFQAEIASLIGRVTERQDKHQVFLAELRTMIERRLPESEELEDQDRR